MYSFFYKFFSGIKNLITWFPIIWSDEWWDHVFFFNIMRKKLVLMEKRFRKEGNFVGRKKDADKMQVCINLLSRIEEDNYSTQAYEKYTKKWGESKLISTPTHNKYLNKVDWEYPNVNNERDEELRMKESIRCFKHSEKQLKNDIELLFKILTKNIRYWWD